MIVNKKFFNGSFAGAVIASVVVLLSTGCGNTKKDTNAQETNTQNTAAEVSMKPTASDDDPAWVYFTADSSGYYYTYRIKSNGTGLEKLYGSKAGPIWISPDNKYVYIRSQVRFPGDPIDTISAEGSIIWDIEKKKKIVLPFYDDEEPTWGSGWYDNENILYAKDYYSTERFSCLFKQNIHTGDTSVIFYWKNPAMPNAVYNKKDNNYYYIDDSLYVFKGKSRKYQSFPLEYHHSQNNDGSVMFTNNYTALFFYNFNKISGMRNIVTDLKGNALLVIDKSIDQDIVINYVKIDKYGKWIYYEGYFNLGGTDYCVIKRQCVSTNKLEIIYMNKLGKMPIEYIALGYDQ